MKHTPYSQATLTVVEEHSPGNRSINLEKKVLFSLVVNIKCCYVFVWAAEFQKSDYKGKEPGMCPRGSMCLPRTWLMCWHPPWHGMAFVTLVALHGPETDSVLQV